MSIVSPPAAPRLVLTVLPAAGELLNPANGRCALCGRSTGGTGALCGSCVSAAAR